jgi:serine/threonine protein kinase
LPSKCCPKRSRTVPNDSLVFSPKRRCSLRWIIATIYGLEQSGATLYLVLELVPGDTLQQRVKRGGPVPIEEALAIAKQIAEALQAAHEKGIIHRDLKPATVKLTPEGKVKVLDFGLARAFSGDTSTAGMGNSPTLSMAATMQGVILGLLIEGLGRALLASGDYAGERMS